MKIELEDGAISVYFEEEIAKSRDNLSNSCGAARNRQCELLDWLWRISRGTGGGGRAEQIYLFI